MLERACFEQWWARVIKRMTPGMTERELLQEAFMAGWARSTRARDQGWADHHAPPEPDRFEAAIDRLVSRKA